MARRFGLLTLYCALAMSAAGIVLGATPSTQSDADGKAFVQKALEGRRFVFGPTAAHECKEEGPACEAFRQKGDEFFEKLRNSAYRIVAPLQSADRVKDLNAYHELRPLCSEYLIRTRSGEVVDLDTIWENSGRDDELAVDPRLIDWPVLGQPAPIIYHLSFGSRVGKPMGNVRLYKFPATDEAENRTLYVFIGLDWRSKKHLQTGNTKPIVGGRLYVFELPSCLFRNSSTMDTHRIYSDEQRPPGVHGGTLIMEYLDYGVEEYRGRFFLDEHYLAEIVEIDGAYYSLIVESSWGFMWNFKKCPDEQYVIRLKAIDRTYGINEPWIVYYSDSACGGPVNKYN